MKNFQINPNFIKLLDKAEVDTVSAMIFSLAAFFDEKDDRLKEKLLEKGVITPEEMDKFRVLLFSKDYESNKWTFKVPLFVRDEYSDENSLHKLVDILINEYKMTGSGTPNRRHTHNPILINNQTLEAYDYLVGILGEDFEIKKLARVIFDYYDQQEYAMGFARYLREGAYVDYMGSEEIHETLDDNLLL